MNIITIKYLKVIKSFSKLQLVRNEKNINLYNRYLEEFLIESRLYFKNSRLNLEDASKLFMSDNLLYSEYQNYINNHAVSTSKHI